MQSVFRGLEQHELEQHNPTLGGVDLPIVDGKYEAKLGTTYATMEEGISEIKRQIQKSRRIRISNIPMSMLEEFKPLLKDRDLMVILPVGERPDETLRELGPMATTKARIYTDFKGTEANAGSIYFARTVYNIAWANDKILNIATMEYGKCVKCMQDTFDGGWRYAQKW